MSFGGMRVRPVQPTTPAGLDKSDTLSLLDLDDQRSESQLVKLYTNEIHGCTSLWGREAHCDFAHADPRTEWTCRVTTPKREGLRFRRSHHVLAYLLVIVTGRNAFYFTC